MTIMGSQGFNVPTIPPDLRREETIHQIADALEYLDKVSQLSLVDFSLSLFNSVPVACYLLK